MSSEDSTHNCSAFQGSKKIGSGSIGEIAVLLHGLAENGHAKDTLVFEDGNAQQIDLDLRGTREEVLERLRLRFPGISAPAGAESASGQPGPGRPKLGVVAREVTLLPRHWEWLNTQPGGASVALRKLVEAARLASGTKEESRRSREATYRFISAMAGNKPDFEEATRALFARDREKFNQYIASWPKDIRDHAQMLAVSAFS
ncbi:MAG: DUF2239 family protein [Cyanobacteria bacterium SZAS LIN-3]|nr:DUF2239 family protein [Cyanobacteria bacterium SZAS LIN-3]